MISLLEIFLLLPAAALLALAGFLLLEVAGALLPPRRPGRAAVGPIAVVVPAHDEEDAIAATVAHLQTHLRAEDRLIVVADNCSDATAARAREAGAEVLERREPDRRGKGYALACAVEALRQAPPVCAVFVDADCRIDEGAVAILAEAAVAAQRPAQALYLMIAPDDAPPGRKVSEFAWLFLNRARMSGLFTLFDVCRLTGSGMAIPFHLAERADFGAAEIVEDLALGLRFAEKGAAPVFVASATVRSWFPTADRAAVRQRARWEHGSLRLAWRLAPGLFVGAWKRRDLRLAAATLDLCVPPLTVFGAVLLIALAAAAPAALAGANAPFEIVGLASALFASAVALGWAAFGRAVLPASAIGAFGPYLRDKFKVYGAKARASTSGWTRTDRDPQP